MSVRQAAPAAAWLAAAAAALALCVIMYGAFVRLSNAGLSCPDWPTCYGQITWPKAAHEVARADAAFPQRPVEMHKTWREQTHRMAAGTLGVLVLALALVAVWRRRWARLAAIAAAVAAALAVALYMSGMTILSLAFGGLAMALPLAIAWRLPRAPPWRWAVVALGLVIFQAALGMWTVTLLLKPIVVMGHLLGGMALFAVLIYVALRLFGLGANDNDLRGLRFAVGLGIVLLACQIALGGWTSSNYAALACGFGASAFPHCLGQWWPPMDFQQGFVLWRGIAVDFQGGILDLPARTAIQMAHRIGALVVFVYLGWVIWRALRRGLPGYAAAIAAALVAQVLLGISNVHFGLPLPVATAHNGMAALLLAALLVLLARTQPPWQSSK